MSTLWLCSIKVLPLVLCTHDALSIYFPMTCTPHCWCQRPNNNIVLCNLNKKPAVMGPVSFPTLARLDCARVSIYGPTTYRKFKSADLQNLNVHVCTSNSNLILKMIMKFSPSSSTTVDLLSARERLRLEREERATARLQRRREREAHTYQPRPYVAYSASNTRRSDQIRD